MLSASAKFTETLAASHRPLVRVGIYVPNGVSGYDFAGYAGVVSGSFTVDYRRNIRRQASLRVSSLASTLDTAFSGTASRDYLEALTADSAEIELQWGLQYPDLSEEYVTLGRMRVEESTLDAVSAALDITAAYDGGTRVADFYLVTPYAPYDLAGVKLTYLEAIQDLVNVSYPSTAQPSWDVDPAVDDTSLPPDGTVFTGDRWSAINDLAKAINVTVGPDNTGTWVVAPISESRDVQWTVSHGQGGVLVQATSTFSRREQYNAVGVRWELPDGSGGLAYIVDNDPASPTYYDGPFGRKPRPEETLDTITTSQQAIDAATSLLNQYKGKTRGIALTTVHNPLLEPNDCIAVFLPDGSAERHVIDAVTLPIGGGTMSVETRILRGGITYEQDGVIYDDSGYDYSGQEV
jgi:hypothetical protein